MASEGFGLEIQERDVEVLLGLFECRAMSLRHVTDLFFGGKAEAAKKRVQKLKRGGYVKERPRAIGEPSVLHLSAKAFEVLSQSGRLDAFPPLSKNLFQKRSQMSELTLRHELQVMDVRCAIAAAIRKEFSLSVTEFSTWPALNEFNAQQNSALLGRKEFVMKPDGFLRIREEEAGGAFEHMFFLEVDRSTEAQEIIGQKAAAYLDFYQKGGMALRFGGRREDFRDFPFRVLMIFRNDERRNNAAERLLRNTPPILTQVWLTTFSEVLANPLGPIWIRPKDYLKVTMGTRFDPSISGNAALYRRQVERERMVEAGVFRSQLFGEVGNSPGSDNGRRDRGPLFGQRPG